MKKTIIRVLILLCCLTFILGTAGCGLLQQLEPEDYLPEYENDYFRYAVRTVNGEKKGYLVGLTELGAEQTELILPQEIDGVPIVGMGYRRKNVWDGPVGRLESDNLKKFYIPFSMENWSWEAPAYFENCTNVKIYDTKFLFGSSANIVSYVAYKQLISHYKYNVYSVERRFLANVSFMYNYEGAENDGYYWIDSYDNDLITFIPPEPKRDGYTFGGWYKEPKCLNIWNFESDKTGDELLIDENTIAWNLNNFSPTLPPQYDENDGIKLYAQWIRI